MPLPKYYCDYCDKQFQDTPVARRRHLQGAMHQRAKKAWFDSFIHDPQPFQTSGQRMCSQFMRTGFCSFGNRCRYQHFAASKNQPPTGTSYEAPAPNFFNLPPSLRPPLDKAVWSLPKLDWG